MDAGIKPVKVNERSKLKATPIQKGSCQNCHGRGYRFNLADQGHLNAEWCQHCENALTTEPRQVVEARCSNFNRLLINPDGDVTDLAHLLAKNGIKHQLLDSFKGFMSEWPQIKKQLRRAKIMSNPEEHHLVRPVEDSQVTALHLLTRNALFIVVGDRERRQKFMETSPTTGENLDKVVNRDFYGWGGQIHFLISGPIVCTYDQNVFYACVRLHHSQGFKGLTLETNFSQLWKAMGHFKNPGGTVISTLKRSLERLHKISVSAKTKDNKRFWGGGLIDTVQYVEGQSSRSSSIRIRFNESMVTHYLSGAYATLELEHFHSLRAYARRMYEFLMSHESSERRMLLETWRDVLGFSLEVANKTVRQRIREAISELVEKQILLAESGFEMVAGKTHIVTSLNLAFVRKVN